MKTRRINGLTRAVATALLMLCSSAAVAGQDAPQNDQPQENQFSGVALMYKWGGGAKPLSMLPKKIEPHAPDGKLTAYADYDEKFIRDGWTNSVVPLYVVNRSDKTIELSLQDGHPNLFMEVLVDGKWQRAMPYSYSWCGNSYHRIKLGPDSFAVFAGDLPSQPDAVATARFRRQHTDGVELVTNATKAMGYSKASVRAAERDPVGVRFELPFETLVGMFEGEIKPTTNGWGTEPWNICLGLAMRFPKQTLEWVSQWDKEKAQANKNDIPSMFSSILGSKLITADDIIGFYEDPPNNAFLEQVHDLPGQALTMLGQRFPAEAINYYKQQDLSIAHEKVLFRGMSQSYVATFDQMLWTLKRIHAYQMEGTFIGDMIGRRFGDEALAARGRIQNMVGPEEASDTIKRIEWYAIGALSGERLIDLVEGRILLVEVDQDEAFDYAMDRLVEEYESLAEAAAERWAKSDDPDQAKAGQRVQTWLRLNREAQQEVP